MPCDMQMLLGVESVPGGFDGEQQEAEDQEPPTEGGGAAQPARPAQGEREQRAAEQRAAQEQTPAGAVEAARRLVREEPEQDLPEAAVHEVAGGGVPDLMVLGCEPGGESMGAEGAGENGQSTTQGPHRDPRHIPAPPEKMEAL